MWGSCHTFCGKSCFSSSPRDTLIFVPSDLSDVSADSEFSSPDRHDLLVRSDPPALEPLPSAFPLEPQRMQRDESSASDALNPPDAASSEPAAIAAGILADAAAAASSAVVALAGAAPSAATLASLGFVHGGEAAAEPFALGELPESLLGDVLRHLKPTDVLRLSLVSRAFRDAAAAESVWENRLPESLTQLIPQASPSRVSSRLAFRALCEGVHMDEGRQRLSLHPATGALCVCVSLALAARSQHVDILRGGVLRDWQRLNDEPRAFFHTSVLLRPVGGYRVASSQQGIALPRQLPAGRYAVGWRVRAQHAAPNLVLHCDSTFSLNNSSAIWRRHCQPLAATWQVLSVGDILLPSTAGQPGVETPDAVLTVELEQLQGKGSQPPVVIDCVVLQQRRC